MGLGSRTSRARCALVWVITSVFAAVLARALLTPVADGLAAVQGRTVAAAGFASVLVWGCAAVGIVVTCWLWLVATVVVADAWRGVTPVRQGIPVGVRRVTLALCGIAMTGLPAPVSAAGGHAPPATPPALSGLRLPERVSVSPEPDAGPAPRRGTWVRRQQVVVVEPGDTLWEITAAHLGPGASDNETARAWPAVYALNRAVIGDDPGRIKPGQRLLLPTGVPTSGLDGSGR